jgi:hypothetical protein
MTIKKVNRALEEICNLQNLHKALILINEAFYKEIYRAKSKAIKHRLIDFYLQEPSHSAAIQL